MMCMFDFEEIKDFFFVFLRPCFIFRSVLQFFGCLVILFACEVAAGIWGFMNRETVSSTKSTFTAQKCLVLFSDNLVSGCDFFRLFKISV